MKKLAKLLVLFGLVVLALLGCTPAQHPADVSQASHRKLTSAIPANEGTSVTLCGDSGFVIRNCVYQYTAGGDWFTQGINMQGLTAFIMNPQCIQAECLAYDPYPVGSGVCMLYDTQAKVRSPSSYSAFAPNAYDVRPAPTVWPTVWTLWCGTNANHQVGDHLHVRDVTAPL